MTRRLRWLIAAAVVLLVGYGGILAVYPQARPWQRLLTRRAAGPRDRSSRRGPPQVEREDVSVTIAIPPKDEVGPLEGCPKDRLETILGVKLSHAHGLCVGTVAPDGPAAKAGIEPGDQLAERHECPSTTIGRFLPRDDIREVRLTLRRPKAEGSEPDESAGEAGEAIAEGASEGTPSP